MSCSAHSPPAKRRKADGHMDSLPANATVSWLFLLPWDIWTIVRDLAGAKEAAAWKSVCQQFKTVVTTPEFWAHFQFEFNLNLESHRHIFSLFGPVCRTTKHLQRPGQLTTLCLEFSMITDADLQAALLRFTQLERLGLTWCLRITDSTLRFLRA
eukprot:g68478.t1